MTLNFRSCHVLIIYKVRVLIASVHLRIWRIHSSGKSLLIPDSISINMNNELDCEFKVPGAQSSWKPTSVVAPQDFGESHHLTVETSTGQ